MFWHPMIVHFPIALLLTAVALDAAGFVLKRPALTQGGFYALCLGCAGAIAAYLTGGSAKHALVRTPEIRTLVGLHQSAALAVVGLSGLLVLFRLWNVRRLQGKPVGLYFAGAVLLVGAVSITGWYGGEVVYGHGGGVQAPAVEAVLRSQTPPPAAAPATRRSGEEDRGGPGVPDLTGQAVVNGLWVGVIVYLVLLAGVLLAQWRALPHQLLAHLDELLKGLLSDWSRLWTITRP